MKRLRTIKFRITIWYSVFIMVLIGVTLFLLCFFSTETIKSKMTANLKSEVMQVSHILAKQHNAANDAIVIDNNAFEKVTVYDMQGQYVTGKYLYDFDNISFEDDSVREIDVLGTKYIVYDFYKEIRDNGMWIRGTARIDFTESFNNIHFKILSLLLPILLLLAIIGGFFIIRIAFVPINKIIDTANGITLQNDISKRIPLKENSPKDELYMMTVTLNNMLDKIQKQFEREKQITLDISHELRTPISVILSYSEYLNELVTDEKEKELAAKITQQTKKITRLISKLLMLSRIESGKQQLNTETVNIGELIEAVAEGMRERALQKQIIIKTEIKDEIILSGDEALLMSAFVNLMDNAVKYGRQGGYIHIKVQKSDGGSEISFEDNGIGISNENINKIWDSFYRADVSRHNEDEGYGLGLALVKSIAELHGGQVLVSSKLGQGTVFKIIFKN